jgi:hypothetical protein
MRRITMGSIYEGDICKLEQEKIKGIIDNIRENLLVGMNDSFLDNWIFHYKELV